MPVFTRPMRRRSGTAMAALGLLMLTAHAASRLPNAAPGVTLTSPTGGDYVAGTTITFTAAATDRDGSISRVDFLVDGARVGSDWSAPYGYTWSASGIGGHTIKAVAVDNRKATGTSTSVAITVKAASDSIAPSVPSGLVATAANAASITLGWSAASDNVGGSGVSRYEVFRDGQSLATTTSPGYTDSGLVAATGYTYTVRAIDVAGNASAHSPGLVATTTDATSASAPARRVTGYFTQWGIYGNKYFVKNLDASGSASKLTHLVYAFGNVRNDRCEVGVLKATDANTGEGGDAYADYSRTHTAAESVDGVADVWGAPLRGNWNQLRKLKARYPGMKVMISLGGWTWSRGFASASRPENRAAFVASCIDAYIRGDLPAFDNAGGAGAAAGVFDGFDIDWEYPAACGLTCGSPEDTANFTALLAEFRRQLDAIRPGLQLTVAVGGGIDKIRMTRPDLYHPYVDAINVMTYDFHGSWESRTNFHSALFNAPGDPSTGDAALYNTHDAIQAFLTRGVPASKLHLGVASYGRGWTNVGRTNNGLFQSGSPAAGTVEPGVERYTVLKTLTWPRYIDAGSKAAWIFDGSTFWSFDDPQTIADKVAYAQAQGLGGAFLWDFSGDDAQGSLMTALARVR